MKDRMFIGSSQRLEPTGSQRLEPTGSQRLEPPKRLLGVQKLRCNEFIKLRCNEFIELYFCFVLLVMVIIVPAAWSEVIQKAVVITTASNYSSGAHAVVSVDPIGGPRDVQKNLLPSESDLGVVAYGSYFFRLGKYKMDHITKFHISEPDTPIWQFSVNDTDTESANPHDMIFVNNTKAYVLRYGSSKAWIVNPSATTEDEFKIGELDLSSYDEKDGKPEMHQGIILGKKLFIILQRQDSSGGYGNWILNEAWAAVFDIDTDTEIITGKGNDMMKGIPLPAKNPQAVQYLKENNTLYIPCAGRFSKEYSGGIVTINPDTYESALILDDGDDDNHPYGNISGMAVVSPEKGYFVGYAGWGDNSLYSFDSSTGEVIGKVADDYLNSKNIAGMESGTYTDKNGMLWVCNATDGEIVIINPADDSIDEKVSTELNPQKVVFVTLMENPEEWVHISGTVQYEENPLCAMVLANGPHMFTCDGNGTYEMDVPLDANGMITLFAFCDGLAPFKQVLDPWDAANFDIHMTSVSADSKEITITKTLETSLGYGWVKISGTVFYAGLPLNAMVLANGQHIFSDAADGSYELEVPTDANGEVTLFVFCDGLPPFKQIFKANPSSIATVNTKGDDEANISVINFRTGETYNDLLSVADSCDLVQYGEDIYIVDKGNEVMRHLLQL